MGYEGRRIIDMGHHSGKKAIYPVGTLLASPDCPAYCLRVCGIHQTWLGDVYHLHDLMTDRHTYKSAAILERDHVAGGFYAEQPSGAANSARDAASE